MDITADQFELFPNVERQASPKGFLRQFVEATNQHGPLATQSQIAAGLGVSKQRVGELVKGRRFATVDVAGRTYIPIASLEMFLTEERHVGRPIKQPSHWKIFKASFDVRK